MLSEFISDAEKINDEEAQSESNGKYFVPSFLAYLFLLTFAVPGKINLNINLCDINYNNHSVYDSTFLSFAYEVKCSHEFRNLDTFTGLRPTVEELRKIDSKLYNTLIDLIEEENLND